MNNNSENTERKETAMNGTLKKSDTGSMVRTANGVGAAEFSIVWTPSRRTASFNGLVGSRVRFEIVTNKYGFSLFDLAQPENYRFFDNYPTFADSGEAALHILETEAAQVARQSLRNAARFAFIQLGLTA